MGAACRSIKRVAPNEDIVIGYAYEEIVIGNTEYPVDVKLCEGNGYYFTVSQSSSCSGNIDNERGYCSSHPFNFPFDIPLYQVLFAPPDGSPGYAFQDINEDVVNILPGPLKEQLCYVMLADEVSRNLWCTTIDGAYNPMFLMSFGGLLTAQSMYILYPFLLLTWIVMFLFMIKRCIKTLCCKNKSYKRVSKIDLDDDIEDCEKEDDKD